MLSPGISNAYLVSVVGLTELDDYGKIPAKILTSARQAINKTATRARAASARRIRDQINFPASYLTDQGGRLTVSKFASNDSLSATIRGRERPTSLARFLTGGQSGKPGVSVKVKPGGARYMPRAFPIRLRAGSSNLDTKANLGLAVRTKDGAKPRNSYKPKQIGENLWLLYAPSVAQVFRSVAAEIQPETLDFLDTEFRRLLNLELT